MRLSKKGARRLLQHMAEDPPNPLAQASLERGRTVLRSLCMQVQMLKQQATALGIFVADRELLTCPQCSLMEDVLIDGTLVTYIGEVEISEDSGLRFAEREPGLFTCPSCNYIIKL